MKWVFRLIGLVVVLVVVLVASLFFLPADKIAQIATDQLRAATGRDVAIKGDVELTFWPVLGLRAGDLEVSNADWSEQGPMLQAENAAIGVDAASLLSGEIRITNIEAESPTIRLDQRLDGRASWEFTDASGEAQIETKTEPTREARPVSIQRLAVTNATLIYDLEGSDRVAYEGVDLTLDWPERLGPAEIAAVVRPAAQDVTVTAKIDGFAGFIAGEVRLVTARISATPGSVDFNGRASTAGEVEGALGLKTSATGAFLGALGLPIVDLPPKLGRSVDLQTNLTLTSDRQLALRDLSVDLAGNRLTGAADISLNGIPQINAQLDAGALDLTSATGGGSGAGGSNVSGGSGQEGWSRSPIDAGGLSSFNGDIALSAQSIDLGQFALGKTRAVLRNSNARMVFELSEVNAYDGLITGEFVLNNRGGLSVGGQMNVRTIQMQPFLNDAIGLDRLTGEGDLRLSFLGSGPSVHAIMNSLSGNGSLAIGRGTIQGIDLDRLLRSGETGGGTTIFDNLTASWSIAAGVLSNRDLLFQLKNYQANGEGVVGLGAQTVDYTFTPVAIRANDGRGLSIPVRFVGPWSDVSIRPDIEAAMDAKLDEEKEKLEQKAKEKLSEELGIVGQEGQSTEDAIKDELKDKLLRKLFD